MSIVLLNNPRATVEIFKLLVNIKGVKNSTQDKINANMKAAIKPGLNKDEFLKKLQNIIYNEIDFLE